MNKPKFVKWINNIGMSGSGKMCPPSDFEKGKIFNTKTDQFPFPSCARDWDIALNIYYSNNFEECLPEKWYLVLTKENIQLAEKWRIINNCSHLDYPLNIGEFLLSKHLEDNSCLFATNELPFNYDDYIEIKTDEFKRLAFKESKIHNGYIAFKGFNEKMECRWEKFEFGITYSKPHQGRKPTLCSTDGYHYCDRIKNIDPHYCLDIAYNNKFCLIEILDDYTKDGEKGITYSFRIIRELTRNEIDNARKGRNFEQTLIDNELDNYEEKKKLRDENELQLKEKLNIQIQIDLAVKEKLNQLKQEEQNKIKSDTDKMAKAMKLDLVKKFQEQYPHTQIGGSVGLFLHGLRLDRFKQTINDFDIITPYYTKFENLSTGVRIEEMDNEGRSGNDFTECITINGIKADIRIDNTQKYDIIEFEGFKYKVSVLEAIWAAKLRYNNRKHINDLKEAMNIGDKI